MKDKIMGDNHRELKIYFNAPAEVNIDEPIIVNVRGGRQLKLDMQVQTIIPRVRIVEDEFDFGRILLASTGTMKMTIVNESNIPATLGVDLT
mmetsp:Transcript_30935/g.28126  ORF Transcript_30935/g.28126 Transcript_30935/m.28126 type:complete len:92 (-) Transcript_30935:115-390(-)